MLLLSGLPPDFIVCLAHTGLVAEAQVSANRSFRSPRPERIPPLHPEPADNHVRPRKALIRPTSGSS